jgi:hypothetical protein
MSEKRIIVLSDGTWETVGAGVVLTLTPAAYDDLLDGIKDIRDLGSNDIKNTEEIA